MMSFFRSYIAPLLIVLTFVIAMVAVSARIFLPGDMIAPAPVDQPPEQATPVTPDETAGTAADAAASGQPRGMPDWSGIT